MIQCKNVEKAYKSTKVISKTNFQIREKKVSLLIGANGTWKTTFIKCMFGLESCLGEFSFHGNPIFEVRNQCFVVWDDTPFYPHLSGLKNLLLFGEGYKSKEEILNVAMDLLDNDLLKRKVKTYSYGQRKKLSLILVDILEPKYLIMDEVSNGLDYDAMKLLQKKIKKWSKEMTIFLTGHQLHFYNGLIDDVYMFRDNKIQLLKKDFPKEQICLEKFYEEHYA